MKTNGVLSEMTVELEKGDTYCVASTLAYVAVPLLKKFRDSKAGYPAYMTEKKWNKKLDKMIRAFELVLANNGSWWMLTEKELKQLDKGLDLFRKYYLDLWT